MPFLRTVFAATILLGTAASSFAQNVSFPDTKNGVFVAKDFKFHTGETMAEVKLGYKTIGDPKGEPVLILHGTAGSADSMMGKGFAGELVRSRPGARCLKILHHHSRCARHHEILEAVGRPQGRISEL